MRGQRCPMDPVARMETCTAVVLPPSHWQVGQQGSGVRQQGQHSSLPAFIPPQLLRFPEVLPEQVQLANRIREL